MEAFLHTWDPNCPTMEHQKGQLGKQFKFHPYDNYVLLMVETQGVFYNVFILLHGDNGKVLSR